LLRDEPFIRLQRQSYDPLRLLRFFLILPRAFLHSEVQGPRPVVNTRYRPNRLPKIGLLGKRLEMVTPCRVLITDRFVRSRADTMRCAGWGLLPILAVSGIKPFLLEILGVLFRCGTACFAHTSTVVINL
jgi:hypothetical protein